jgi:hypothetical protein
LGTATVDLAAAGRRFSQVTNRLQEVSEEVTWLRKSNAKLSEDLKGKSSRHFPSPSHFFDCFLVCPDLFLDISGMRVYRTGMTSKLAEQKQELNTALLKVIKKDGAIECLSEQLQSKSRILVPSPSFLQTRHNLLSCSSSRDQSQARAVADGSGAGCG